MGKKHFKSRMKGGDGPEQSETTWQRFKKENPKTAFSGKAGIALLVIIGVFVGTWAAFGFSTSLDTISIAVLAVEILYIVFILPWVYWKMLKEKTTGFGTERQYTLGLQKAWFPQRLMNWFGFFIIIVLWIGLGLGVAAAFGGNYESNIIKGIAASGLIFVLLGSIDVFRSIGVATGKVLLDRPIGLNSNDEPRASNIFDDTTDANVNELVDDVESEYEKSIRDSSMFSREEGSVYKGGRKPRSSRRRK